MEIPPVTSAANHPPAIQKVTEVARQFEAVLLESFLDKIQESFSTVPGKESSLGMGAYEGLGTQALATGLAQSGGLGIADMIVRHVMSTGGRPLTTDGGIGPKAISLKGR